MRSEFQKVTFWRKLKNWLFQIIASAVWFHVFNETWHICLWSFLVIRNKSARIYLNIFGDFVIQSLKSGQTRKRGLVPISRQEKPAYLFLVFPARLETWQKAFHSYSFIERSRNEAFRHFLVNFIKWLPWKRWPLETFWFQFWLCIFMFYACTKFHHHQVAGEKVSNYQNFRIFCFWPP